jgi:hypothetical protein
VRYYLTEGQDSVADAGYVALSQAQLAESVSRLDAAVSGE